MAKLIFYMRILLIGQDNLQNNAIQEILSSENGSEIIQIAPEEVDYYGDKNDFKIAVIDLTSFSGNLEQFIADLRQQSLAEKLIAVHNYGSERLIQPLLQAGADHYFNIDSSVEELWNLIAKTT